MVKHQIFRILLVEDEKNLASTLGERLSQEGFEVVLSSTVEEACLEIKSRKFALVLLDIGLPDGSGFEVAAFLRKRQPSAALIFLTALSDPEDRVRGLELGAEDYIVKPFYLKELLLRIQNGIKRATYLHEGLEEVELGRAKIFFLRYEAEINGKKHPLTHKECALLKLLVERRGAVVSRDEILNHVWSEQEFPTSRTVDNFVMRLRRLIELDLENPTVIKSIRGVGYQLEQNK